MIPGDTVRTYAGISFYIRINHSIIREQSWNTLLYNYLFFHIFLVYRQTDRTQLSHGLSHTTSWYNVLIYTYIYR